jgi:hypothetical protein
MQLLGESFEMAGETVASTLRPDQLRLIIAELDELMKREGGSSVHPPPFSV